MKDEHDAVTRDAFEGYIIPVHERHPFMIARHALAVASHYQAVKPSVSLKVTGARWVGSTTPDVARDSWKTPGWLFNYFRKMAGGFDLDAAADDSNALCPVYFTEENSCLTQSWGEKVTAWMNPPYSDPFPFIEKAIEEVNERGSTVYALLPDDVSTAWFRLAWDNAAECFPILHNGLPKYEGGKSGRVRFVHATTGKEGGSNNKGSWVFIFRRHRSPLKIRGIDRTECENLGGGIL